MYEVYNLQGKLLLNLPSDSALSRYITDHKLDKGYYTVKETVMLEAEEFVFETVQPSYIATKIHGLVFMPRPFLPNLVKDTFGHFITHNEMIIGTMGALVNCPVETYVADGYVVDGQLLKFGAYTEIKLYTPTVQEEIFCEEDWDF